MNRSLSVFVLALFSVLAIQPCWSQQIIGEAQQQPLPQPVPVDPFPNLPCNRMVEADVVAIDQVLVWNRFGSHDPAGMMYALRQDVVSNSGTPTLQPGNVRLRDDLRPRPLTLRVNKGDCLRVNFQNLLADGDNLPEGCVNEWGTDDDGDFHYNEDGPETILPIGGSQIDDDCDGQTSEDPQNDNEVPGTSDSPRTRWASFHVNGLSYINVNSDGAFVGNNPNSTVAPGGTKTYTFYADEEGTFLALSMGAMAGGEGDGGSLAHGLFGAVNVEPAGSRWAHSVTGEDIIAPTGSVGKWKHQSAPIDAIIHNLSDDDTGLPEFMTRGNFREFTVIFHDELKTCHANALLETEFWLHSVRDAFGINYGCSGLGQMLLDAKCFPDCRYEDFFLTSWANGDPALLKQYSDDPSNVHHSYLGDPVRFRNIHAGPKETHVFHLHAHQWVYSPDDENSTYLDSQTIGPGGAFTYDIAYGGSGNRNLTPGDAIFHCHLYPHFAQGMWELWRVHDVYEDGNRLLPDCTPIPRIAPIPGRALAPLPTAAVPGYPFFIPGIFGHRPPQPALDFDTFEVTTTGGATQVVERNGGLPRHVVTSDLAARPLGTPASVLGGNNFYVPPSIRHGHELLDGHYLRLPEYIVVAPGANIPGDYADDDGDGCYGEDPYNFFDDDGDGLCDEDPWTNGPLGAATNADVVFLPREGTGLEQAAMDMHSASVHDSGYLFASTFGGGVTAYPQAGDGTLFDCNDANFPLSLWGGIYTKRWYDPTVDPTPGDYPAPGVIPPITTTLEEHAKNYFSTNGLPPAPGAPFANPCPPFAPERDYHVSAIQLDYEVNDTGWHDPQARIDVFDEDVDAICNGCLKPEPFFFRANSGDCISFKHTNLIPRELCPDDFQVQTPTDVLGQHIHLVKFDVTSSDGSANGWNYEDGTLSPEEVEDRLAALALYDAPHHGCLPAGTQYEGCTNAEPAAVTDAIQEIIDALVPGNGLVAQWQPFEQTTTQLWWADPLLNSQGHDNTIRTVFTHDHFGPSSIQHHGFYAALVVEPCGSKWYASTSPCSTDPNCPDESVVSAGTLLGTRADGGPTATQAVIETLPGEGHDSYREFCLAIADFAIVYDECGNPINPPRLENEDPCNDDIGPIVPEAISAADPGTMLINYRNEPIPLRIADSSTGCSEHTDTVKSTIQGLMRYVFSSLVHGDPGTPILKTFEGDNVQVRLIQGSQEEQHVFSINGLKWKREIGSNNTSFVNAQAIGISEHFEFGFEMPQFEKSFSFLDADEITAALGVNSFNGEAINANQLQGDISYGWAKRVSDHLYGGISEDDLWNGVWGILRSFKGSNALDPCTGAPVDLFPIPGAGISPDGPVLTNVSDYVITEPVADTTRIERGQQQPVFPGFEDVVAERYVVPGIAQPQPVYGFCPPGAPIRTYKVHAFTAQDLLGPDGIYYNNTYQIHDPSGLMYVLEEDLDANGNYIGYGGPLVIRALPGECLKVKLYNHLPNNVPDHDGDAIMPDIVHLQTDDLTPDNWVGLHPQLVSYSVSTDDGANVGYNRNQLVPPGRARTYCWYTGCITWDPSGTLIAEPAELGVINLRSFGDIIKQGSQGLIGALVVEPAGSKWFKPNTNTPVLNGDIADIRFETPSQGEDFTEVAILYQDGLNLLSKVCQPVCPLEAEPVDPIPAMQNGEIVIAEPVPAPCGNSIPDISDDAEDSGERAFNYATAPFWARLGTPGKFMTPSDMNDVTNMYEVLSSSVFQDPPTPMATVEAGTKLVFRVCQPAGRARQHSFAVHGHQWLNDPENPGSLTLGSQDGMTVGRTFNLWFLAPAGGPRGVAMDYLYRDMPSFNFSQGLWGILRVVAAGTMPVVQAEEPASL